jgi:hypothetical protein
MAAIGFILSMRNDNDGMQVFSRPCPSSFPALYDVGRRARPCMFVMNILIVFRFTDGTDQSSVHHLFRFKSHLLGDTLAVDAIKRPLAVPVRARGFAAKAAAGRAKPWPVRRCAA